MSVRDFVASEVNDSDAVGLPGIVIDVGVHDTVDVLVSDRDIVAETVLEVRLVLACAALIVKFTNGYVMSIRCTVVAVELAASVCHTNSSDGDANEIARMARPPNPPAGPSAAVMQFPTGVIHPPCNRAKGQFPRNVWATKTMGDASIAAGWNATAVTVLYSILAFETLQFQFAAKVVTPP